MSEDEMLCGFSVNIQAMHGSHIWNSPYCKRGKTCITHRSYLRLRRGNQVVLVLCFNAGCFVFLGLTVPVYYRHS